MWAEKKRLAEEILKNPSAVLSDEENEAAKKNNICASSCCTILLSHRSSSDRSPALRRKNKITSNKTQNMEPRHLSSKLLDYQLAWLCIRENPHAKQVSP